MDTFTFFYFLVIFFLLALISLPMFYKRDSVQSRGALIVSWAILTIATFMTVHLALMGYAAIIQHEHVKYCASEKLESSPQLGSWCNDPITEPFPRMIVDNFGGLDSFLVEVIGMPIVFILAITGFIIEFVHRKKIKYSKAAVWSTPFVTLALYILLIILLIVDWL